MTIPLDQQTRKNIYKQVRKSSYYTQLYGMFCSKYFPNFVLSPVPFHLYSIALHPFFVFLLFTLFFFRSPTGKFLCRLTALKYYNWINYKITLNVAPSITLLFFIGLKNLQRYLFVHYLQGFCQCDISTSSILNFITVTDRRNNIQTR